MYPVRRLLLLATLSIPLIIALPAGGLTAKRHIIGGAPYQGDQLGFVGALQYRLSNEDEWQIICTGSVVDEHWFLTAGHCVAGGAAVQYRIALLNLPEKPSFTVDQVKPHPGYLQSWKDASGEYVDGSPSVSTLDAGLDAAMLHSPEPFNVQLPELPSSSSQDQSGRDAVYIAGYGMLSDGSFPEEQIYLGQESLISDEECGDLTVPYISGKIANSRWQLCRKVSPLFGDSAITCNGDSGGPVISGSLDSPTLIGLTSWGTSAEGSCSGKRAIDIYTRVSALYPWLQSLVSGHKEEFSLNNTQLVRINIVSPNKIAASFKNSGIERGSKIRFLWNRFFPRHWGMQPWSPQMRLGADLQFKTASISPKGIQKVLSRAWYSPWQKGECLAGAWQVWSRDGRWSSLIQKSWLVTSGRHKVLRLTRSNCGFRLG